MKIYPKQDIKNGFGQIIWYKNKSYECSKLDGYDLWVVVCEIIANEYPVLDMNDILLQFHTIEDQRDMKIDDVME